MHCFSASMHIVFQGSYFTTGNSRMDCHVHAWSPDKSFMEIRVALWKHNNLSGSRLSTTKAEDYLLFRALISVYICTEINDSSHAFKHYASRSCSEPIMPEVVQKCNVNITSGFPDTNSQSTQVLARVSYSRCIFIFCYECSICN